MCPLRVAIMRHWIEPKMPGLRDGTCELVVPAADVLTDP